MNEQYKMLSFTNFKHLVFWDFYTLSKKNLPDSNYELVPLSKCISHRKDILNIDDNTDYKLCRVQLYGKGVVLREILKGSQIKTKKQQLCREDDFLVAEIDAKFGGYGIVPKELVGAIVSGHYFLFEIDRKVLRPDYLGLVIKCSGFSKQVKSTGSTNYSAIRPSHVLNYVIPLPDLEMQEKLVTAFNKEIDVASVMEEKANKLESGIDDYLFNELSISETVTHKSSDLFYLRKFSDISRWDVWTCRDNLKSRTYPNVKFADVIIGNPMYGANVKGVKTKSDTRYIRITDINEDGSLNSVLVYPEYVDDRYLLKENDFLIARSGNTVGKTFLYKEEHGRCIFAGYLIKYSIDESKLDPRFLLYFTKSKVYKSWISANQRVSGQPNINGQEYLASPVVLPPLSVQAQIVEQIKTMKDEITSMRVSVAENRRSAFAQFEMETFKHE